MGITISTLAGNTAGNALADLIDNGTNNSNGYIEIRTGTKPAETHIAPTGNLLAVCELSNPAVGEFSNKKAIFNLINNDENILEDGIAGWFRIYNCDDLPVIDGTVGVTGSGSDLEFDLIECVSGGTISIVDLTIEII